jgi:hypothetical protein
MEGTRTLPDESLHQKERQLRPTVEVTTRMPNRRTTCWGWSCSCGDNAPPRLRQRSIVLEEAREHFDTKHGGEH